MSRWALVNEDGSIAAQITTPGSAEPHPERDNPNGLRIVAIERFGLPGERLDADGQWVADADAAAAAIDAGHRADHGPRAIEHEHDIKALEARILLGTLATDGLLAREAAAMGRDVMELAAEVVTRARDSRIEAARIARRVGKSTVKGVSKRG